MPDFSGIATSLTRLYSLRDHKRSFRNSCTLRLKKSGMPPSPHFKPETSALVLIDHQVGTMQIIKNITADRSLSNAVHLAKAAQAFKMPVVMTSSQEDHIQGPLHPALQQALPDAHAARVKRVGIVNACG